MSKDLWDPNRKRRDPDHKLIDDILVAIIGGIGLAFLADIIFQLSR